MPPAPAPAPTDLFVVVHDAQCGEDPGAGRGNNVAVCKAHPLEDLGGGLGASTPQLLVTD